jgi:hypothetical protein
MLLAGVPTVETLRVVGIISIQFLTGVVICTKLPIIGTNQLPFLIGSGITLGTSLSTFFHILLRATSFSQIAWLIPSGVALVLLILDRKNERVQTEMYVGYGKRPFLIGFVCIGLALADQWWWLYPILLLAIFAGRLRISLNKLLLKSAFPNAIFTTNLILGSLMICSLYVSMSLKKLNYLWWILSYDIPYLEALSFSINRWGPNENISAVGTNVSYHWFALAWSGMTSDISNAQSWTVLTIAMPILLCFAIACLTFSIAYIYSKSESVSLLLTLAVLLTRDVISMTSPTHLYAFLPFLMIVMIITKSNIQKSFIRGTTPILVFLLFCLFGSKVSTGAVVLIALLIHTWFNQLLRFRFRLFSMVAFVGTTLLAYFYFFGSSGRQGSLVPSFSNTGGRLIVGRTLGGGIFHPFLEITSQLFYFLPLLSGVYLLIMSRKRLANWHIYIFLASMPVIGFSLSRFLDGEGTESYFMHVAFPVSILLIGLVFYEVQKIQNLLRSTLTIWILIITGLLLGLVRRSFSMSLSNGGNYSFVLRMLPYLLMYFLILLISCVFLVRREYRNRFYNCFILVSSLLLISSFVGEQIGRRIDYTRSALVYSSSSTTELNRWNFFAGSPDQVEALRWVANEIPENDVIATNRRCLALDFCGPPKWLLVSALGRHRVLIEGNKSVFPDSTPWIDERTVLSQRFINDPNRSDVDRLIALGVSYHYVELMFIEGNMGWISLDDARTKSWEPFASVVFRNNTTLVLKLNQLN